MWARPLFAAAMGVRSLYLSAAVVLSHTPAVACHTALLLAVDVSNSVDVGEYRIQADGIAAALADPVVIDAMVQGNNRLAIMHWSGLDMQKMVLPWTHIRTPADMLALSQRAGALPRAFFGGNTAVGEAMSTAIAEVTLQTDCERRVIDMSGDGSDNAGTDVPSARRRAERAGITVNGLAIEGLGRAITSYYQRSVTTRDGFVETAQGFVDFARAIRVKIRREISRVIG